MKFSRRNFLKTAAVVPVIAPFVLRHPEAVDKAKELGYEATLKQDPSTFPGKWQVEINGIDMSEHVRALEWSYKKEIYPAWSWKHPHPIDGMSSTTLDIDFDAGDGVWKPLLNMYSGAETVPIKITMDHHKEKTRFIEGDFFVVEYSPMFNGTEMAAHARFQATRTIRQS